MTNPDKYFLQPSNVKYLQVAVLGGPHSGKTVQAQLLAKQYDLVYLNPEEILTRLINGPQNETFQNDAIYQNIIKQLKTGASVSGDTIVALLKREIESNSDKVLPSATSSCVFAHNTNSGQMDGYWMDSQKIWNRLML